MKANKKHKAFAFLGAVFVLLIALLFTGCPNVANGRGNTQTSTVIVRFDETTIMVYAKGDDGVFRNISTGTTVYEGKMLLFESKNLPVGKQIDKWKVNTKELKYYTYKVNAADAVDDASGKVINVTYTLKEALPVIVRFDETTIMVSAEGDDGVFRNISTGTTVYEGKMLLFESKNLPVGKQIDKWKVNTKELKYYTYKVNAADAVDDASGKVINITYTLK